MQFFFIAYNKIDVLLTLIIVYTRLFFSLTNKKITKICLVKKYNAHINPSSIPQCLCSFSFRSTTVFTLLSILHSVEFLIFTMKCLELGNSKPIFPSEFLDIYTKKNIHKYK